MRVFILVCLILLMSCNKKEIDNKIINNSTNKNLTFDELKTLIEIKKMKLYLQI